MPQLDLTWYPSQLFWLCITFFTLYFIMAKFIVPSIADILKRRQDKIDGYLDSALETKEKAEKALASYNEALKNATKKANESLEKTKEDLENEIALKQADLALKLQKQIFDGEAKIQKSKEEALIKVKEISEELAKDVIAKIGVGAIANENIKSAIKAVAED